MLNRASPAEAPRSVPVGPVGRRLTEGRVGGRRFAGVEFPAIGAQGPGHGEDGPPGAGPPGDAAIDPSAPIATDPSLREHRRRRCLRWALLVPFAVLPIPLTIAPPDVYGGFLVHLGWLLALSAAGGGMALLSFAPPTRWRLPPWQGPILRLLFGALFAAQLLQVLGPAVADVSVQVTSLREGRALSQSVLGPGALTSAAAAVFLARLLVVPASRRAAAVALWGFAGMVALPVAGAWFFGAIGVRPPQLGYPATLLLLAALWPRLRARLEGDDRLLVGGLVLEGGLLLSAAVAVGMTGPDRLREALVGLLSAATSTPLLILLLFLITRVLRRASALPEGEGLPPLTVLSSVVAAVIAFAMTPITAAVAPAVVGLLGLPGAAQSSEPPMTLVVAWVGVCVSAFHANPGGPALARARSLVATTWLALLAAMAAPTAWGPAVWLLPGAVALGALLLPPRLRGPHRAGWVDRLPLMLGGALAGAFLVTTLGRSLLPLRVTSVAYAVGGGLLGIGVGLWAASFDLSERGPGERIVRRLLSLLGLSLPMFVAIGWVLAPLPVCVTAAALIAALLLGRLRAWRGPRLRPWVALWLLFYVAYAAVQGFKLPPGPSACAEALEGDVGRVLLDLSAARGEYASAAPAKNRSVPN